ncbi:MAG TPA: hypothetical protein VJN18_34590 [Polyangiaceae bacterium]|nr:hypothetical protein [Polyangiaceae bacterium]
MAGSAVDAISPAVERSQQLLFRPFKADKWFALGFTVFMAQCAEGGGGGSMPNLPGPGRTGSPGGGGSPGLGFGAEFQRIFKEALQNFRDNLGLYLLIGAGVLLFGLAVGLFITWFSSRAKLMFVESVVHDRVDVSAQWSRFAELGFSLFKCRVALGLAVWLTGLGALAAGGVVALPDLEAGQFLGTRALVGYSILAASLLFFAIPLGIAGLVLDDFVVPLMAVRSVKVLEAWRLCRTEVLAGNVGGVVLFYVLRFLLGIGVAMATLVITCLTCCIPAIPYIGTVMLLPLFVFNRAYPLYFMEQLGVTIFPVPEPAWAAYAQWRFPR